GRPGGTPMARQQSQGTCYLCKGTFQKAAMTRHLTRCLAADDTVEKAGAGKRKKGKLVRVVVEGKYDPRYWLYLEMPATARLAALDGVLRKLWLECCGHLSAFKVEGKKRAAPRSLADMLAEIDSDDWRDPDEVDMEDRVGDVLQKGSKLTYDYDF